MGMMSAVDPAAPAPIAHNTHDDAGLPPPIAFDLQAAARLAPGALTSTALPFDPFDLGADSPSTLRTIARAIRPIGVGALLAIPTLGAATVGLVALLDRGRAMAMVEASTAFMAGIPGDIVVLIGLLATGYGAARTFEKTKGADQ